MTSAALLAAVVSAVANLLGAAAVVARKQWTVQALDALIALSAGFMVSVALVSILPEAIVQTGELAAAIALAGYLLVHLTQHALVRHFHFGEETHEVSPVVGLSALAGLLLHTFVDGVAIASGFLVSAELGWLIFVAILLHKFPEGLAISSLFLAAGTGRTRAFLAAAALGVATVLGVLVTGIVEPLARYGLALSAGVTLYVATSNLVPEFQAREGWRIQTAFFAGVGVFLLARAVAGH